MRRATALLALALLSAGCGGGGDRTASDARAGGGAAATAADTAAAPDAGSRTALGVDTLEGAGPYLTDGRGRALYLFTSDTAGRSTCYDACAEAWPPLGAPEGSVTAAAGPVRSGLIGYVSRAGGGTQVTYGGWPLYYFRKDRGSGEATGQDVHGFGGEWYLVTPAGNELHAGEESPEGS